MPRTARKCFKPFILLTIFSFIVEVFAGDIVHLLVDDDTDNPDEINPLNEDKPQDEDILQDKDNPQDEDIHQDEDVPLNEVNPPDENKSNNDNRQDTPEQYHQDTNKDVTNDADNDEAIEIKPTTDNGSEEKIDDVHVADKEKNNPLLNVAKHSDEDFDAFRVKKPLWKIKDVPNKKEETGFDLSPEEIKKFKLWKDGVIPYYIDVVSFNDKDLREKIQNYLLMVNSATYLNFVELPAPPTDDNERWVLFINRRGLLGCADHTVKNFTNAGVQRVVLGYDCMETRGEMAEAVMSIVGVPAQHNAPDRDNYIKVNMENIMPDKRYMFEKWRDDQWLFHDLEYDFESVTHFDVYKHTVNGHPTIQIKDNSTELNPPKTFSGTDLLKIEMLYNYITRNVKLQRPSCKKMFQSPNRFQKFVPNRINVQPREKPSRYISGGNTGHVSLKGTFYDNKQWLKGPKAKNNEKFKSRNIHAVNYKHVSEAESKERRRPVSKLEALTLLSDYSSE